MFERLTFYLPGAIGMLIGLLKSGIIGRGFGLMGRFQFGWLGLFQLGWLGFGLMGWFQLGWLGLFQLLLLPPQLARLGKSQ
jgi:hypothetical protein